jgi:hypothetical protein
MTIVDRSQLLQGSNLKERTVFIKGLGGEVVVKPLGALFATEAQSKATEFAEVNGEQIFRRNAGKLITLQILHGLVDPKLNSELEAEQFLKNWDEDVVEEIISAIVEVSEVSEEAISTTEAEFPKDKAPAGTDEPDVADGAEPGPGGPGDSQG